MFVGEIFVNTNARFKRKWEAWYYVSIFSMDT